MGYAGHLTHDAFRRYNIISDDDLRAAGKLVTPIIANGRRRLPRSCHSNK
jgi:hypothetical protein